MRRINRCLNTRLIEICKRTVQLEELNSKLYGFLPNTLQKYCHVGSFNRGCLVIVVNDPVWASELRYSIPELRDKLRKEAGIYQLTSIKLMVATIESSNATKHLNTPSLSTKARDVILSSKEQCSYQPLKDALAQLARAPDDKNLST